jgi:hypothetical protein
MRIIFIFLTLILLISPAFATYVIGNLAITGTGGTVSGLKAGNIGIGTLSPGQALDIQGTIRSIGIGTTVPQELCRKSDGSFGVYNGAWAGACT